MTKLLRLVLFTLVLWLPAQQANAQTNSFAHPEIAGEAQRYENELATKAAAASRPQQDLIAYAKRALNAGDARAAAGALAQAAVLAPENAETWLLLARAVLATSPDPNRPSERYELPANASAAAYLAYRRAASPAVKRRRWQCWVVLSSTDRSGGRPWML